MFLLPIPLHKTMETLIRLIDVKESGDECEVPLASSDLYIIVNCKPTKEKVVWHSL